MKFCILLVAAVVALSHGMPEGAVVNEEIIEPYPDLPEGEIGWDSSPVGEVKDSLGLEDAFNANDRTPYFDCGDLMKAGYNASGTYKLTHNETKFLIRCEFQGGFADTIILQRNGAHVSFLRPMSQYESGFGGPTTSYFAGLRNIYSLTHKKQVTLHVVLADWSGTMYRLIYDRFHIEDKAHGYRLHLSGHYHGGLPDELSFHNGAAFATYDYPDKKGCAIDIRAGWWYNYCVKTLGTGIYYRGTYKPTGKYYNGVFWRSFHGFNYSLKNYIMMIRSWN